MIADSPTTDATTPNHGSVVSAVAKAPDTTPDTNHGADVSAVARDNHGHATPKKPHPSKPDHTGKPDQPGKPDHTGKP